MVIMLQNRSGLICRDKLWDTNLTWYTENPEFTECFQKIILTVTPCIAFWVAALINLGINRKQTSNFPLPWTFLNLSKLILCVVLILLSAIEMAFSLYERYTLQYVADVDIYAAGAKFITYVLVLIIMLRNCTIGNVSSTLLSLYWLLTVFCSLVTFRSTILRTFFHDFTPVSKYQYIPELLYYPIVFCQFLLSFFQDKNPGISLEARNPFDTCSFYSFVTFSWLNNLVRKSQKKLIFIDDLPPLPRKLSADYLWRQFEANWAKEMQKHKLKIHRSPNSLPSLGWVILKSLWPWISFAFTLQFIHNFLVFAAPLMLGRMLTFIANDEYVWKGYLFAFVLFLSQLLPYAFYIIMLYYSVCFGIQCQSTISSVIYRKALKLSSAARKEYMTGEIVNLVSVDVNRIYQSSIMYTFTMGAPVKVLFTVGFLWVYLGISCLAGIGVLVALLLLSTSIARKISSLQKKQMAKKDARMKYMTEILNGIKVLKFYAWEKPFMNKILDIRLQELKYIRFYQLLYSTYSFIFGCAPFLVAVASFVTFVLVSSKNVLTPNIVFVSLSLLNILRTAVLQVPSLTSETIQMVVSLRRIAKFLAAEEHDSNEVGMNPDPNEVISIRNATFFWDKGGESILKDIDFHIPQGSLVAVIGEVASGKSSLLSSILGETYKLSGTVDVKGEIAYVPQQAWILNQTVKENIIFVNSMVKSKYDQVIKCCCLEHDLKILAAGDNTEIGEKGVNLSGGQKQRVSLARAVYNDADIYLFDDPLSAVDAHVGKHLFDQVIGNNGLLKDKSRILVTHNISMLAEADFIITMKDGRIIEQGTFDELMNQKSFFADLITEYLNVENADNKSDEPESLLSTEDLKRQDSNMNQQDSNMIQQDSNCLTGEGRLTEEERMEIGKVKLSVITCYIKNASYILFSSMCFGYLGNQALDIGANVWLSEWSNDKPTINGTYDPALRNERIEVYATLGFFQAILIVMGTVSTALGGYRAGRIFHQQMLASVMRSPMSFFDTTPVGRILNRFGRDIDDIDLYIPDQLDTTFFYICAGIGSVVLISSKIPIFLSFFVPVAIVLYFLQKIYLNTSRQLKRISSALRSPVYSHLTESVQGASSISAYNVGEIFIKKMETKVNNSCLSQFMWTTCVRWLDVRTAVIGNIITLLTCVMSVYLKDHLSSQVVGLLIIYALSGSDTMRFLVRCFTDLENRAIAIERVVEYSSLKPEAPWEIPETSPILQWPEAGSVQLQNYSTKYRENLDLVLNDLTLRIADNEKIGIVGRTGAGKSSLTLALFRIIEPVSGTIIIDGIDVSSIGLHELRSKLTIIPQDPVLFTGPLRINLDPNEEYTDDELWSSLEHSSLKPFVSSLAEGLSHEITEGGSNLSVGQRQLVCLARALLRKSKILILDEATAAIDVETDSLIQNSIKTQFKKHTVITIAHRLNTIMDYDTVVVMDSGKICEVGKPTDLLEKSDSLFYSLAKDAGLV